MNEGHSRDWDSRDHDRLIRIETELSILKKIVYGAVSIVLGGVLAAVLALVLR